MHGWTPERRARQADAIRRWRPWERATGPRSKRVKHESRGMPIVAGIGRHGGKWFGASTRCSKRSVSPYRGPEHGARAALGSASVRLGASQLRLQTGKRRGFSTGLAQMCLW